MTSYNQYQATGGLRKLELNGISHLRW